MRTLDADYVQGIAPDAAEGSHGRVHASGNKLLGAFLQLARLVRFAGHLFLPQKEPKALPLRTLSNTNGCALPHAGLAHFEITITVMDTCLARARITSGCDLGTKITRAACL